MNNDTIYSVAIIGGGASGTALLYTLAHYTNLPRIALLEKYDGLGKVNSQAKNNSQTLHTGDIETNYTVDKIRQVKPAALMVARYGEKLPKATRDAILFPTHKMVLAVGEKEVAMLEKRHEAVRAIFPELKKLTREEIAEVEPAVMAGRDPKEPVLALFNPTGYAVNFGTLAQSFAHEAKKNTDKTVDVFLERPVISITRDEDGLFTLHTAKGTLRAETVVVDADAYSLGFAKAMGYGLNFSLIPIAGTFYFTDEVLRGKVYTLQEPRLPFAAAHGDPDITMPGKTRWGPTAQFWPVLESRELSTMAAYFRSAGLEKWRTWKSFALILSEPVRLWYLIKNIFYILPFVGTYFFVKNIQKIVPTIRARNVTISHGYGGMRLQRVDISKNELQLGEGKIIGENIIFNMTPSPGASVCLHNGLRDAEQLMVFFGGKYSFAKEKMIRDLVTEADSFEDKDTSATQSYSS